jgi:hypothetical protein
MQFLTQTNMKTLKAIALLGVVAAGASAMANTITPSATAFVPGVSITYDANHTSGQLQSGDGFTIYDVFGYNGTVVAPVNWAFTSAVLTGSPYDVLAPFNPNDSNGLFNITFHYTGSTVTDNFNTIPQSHLYTGFVIGTTAVSTTEGWWASRDHLLSGGLGTEHLDQVTVPAPDGGASAMLLGIGVLGLGAFRNKLRRA